MSRGHDHKTNSAIAIIGSDAFVEERAHEQSWNSRQLWGSMVFVPSERLGRHMSHVLQGSVMLKVLNPVPFTMVDFISIILPIERAPMRSFPIQASLCMRLSTMNELMKHRETVATFWDRSICAERAAQWTHEQCLAGRCVLIKVLNTILLIMVDLVSIIISIERAAMRPFTMQASIQEGFWW